MAEPARQLPPSDFEASEALAILRRLEPMLTKLDERVSKLDDRISKLDERVSKLDDRLRGVEIEIAELRGRMSGVEARLNQVPNLFQIAGIMMALNSCVVALGFGLAHLIR